MARHLGEDLISHNPWRISERGPWQSKEDPTFWYVNVISGGLRVARVSGVGRDRALANAQLITVAPDLLEACKTVFLRVKNTNINTPLKDMSEEWEILNQAINKAEKSN